MNEREDAISLVTGVILMATITMILAAVIAVVVFETANQMRQPVHFQCDKNSARVEWKDAHLAGITFIANGSPALIPLPFGRENEVAISGTYNITSWELATCTSI